MTTKPHSNDEVREELKKHCWVDERDDHQMPLDEVVALLTQKDVELQKAREEVWNKIYQYADRELDGEVWLHGSQIIRRAKEDGVIIDQSELDQPTDCTCDGFDTCYKHSEQLEQTFNPTN